MGANRHLDVNKAVNNFLKHFESLSCLPLITDAEMDQLYDEEVTAALNELEQYNRQKKLCSECDRRCCLRVRCEFYSPELSQCPIHPFRPLLCRMHFCEKYTAEYGYLVKELGDIFLESLLAAGRLNSNAADLFDCPTFGALVPALTDSISRLLNAFREGRLDEATALKAIIDEVERHEE